MSRRGEDVYETSAHKKNTIPMVLMKKEADWKAWRSGLVVAAKYVGLPHVLMSVPVDRVNESQVQIKSAGPRAKKKLPSPKRGNQQPSAPSTQDQSTPYSGRRASVVEPA
jgi:hypothetical protein